MIENAREMCGSRASEEEVLETAIYYATKWTGYSEEEAKRIFIDNEPPGITRLEDLDQETREWLLSGKKRARP